MPPGVLIFVHQPKTGGATLRKLMERYYSPEETFVIHDVNPRTVQTSIDRLRALPQVEKLKIRAVTGHGPFGIHRFLPQPATYITMLRNPVERILSHIGHVMRHQRAWSADDVRNWGQEEFVASGGKPEVFLDWMEKFGLDNLQTRCLIEPPAEAWDRLAEPQPPLPPDALTQARKVLAERFAVVGTMERYDETLLLVKRRLGWKSIYYTKTNITPGRKSQREIGDEGVAMIRERNRLDYELWQYAGELLEGAINREGPEFSERLRDYQIRNARYGRVHNFLDGAREKIQLRTRLKRLLRGRSPV